MSGVSRGAGSYANHMGLWESLSQDWQIALEKVQPLLIQIENELDHRITEGKSIAPERANIFAALPSGPEKVKVIIVGQDPYPTLGHATGLAFSVPEGTKPLPPTLRNILTELHDDIPESISTCDDLSAWRSQGVLLLNQVLTTQVGESLAHQHLGWNDVTLEIVRAVRKLNPQVIGVLWGKHAQQLSAQFDPQLLVRSVHPSPLSAYRGFFGSKPFSLVNRLLEDNGQNPVTW